MKTSLILNILFFSVLSISTYSCKNDVNSKKESNKQKVDPITLAKDRLDRMWRVRTIDPVPEEEKINYDDMNTKFKDNFPDLQSCINGFSVKVLDLQAILSGTPTLPIPETTLYTVRLYSALAANDIYSIVLVGEKTTIVDSTTTIELLKDKPYYQILCDNGNVRVVTLTDEKKILEDDIKQFYTDINLNNKLSKKSYGIAIQKANTMLKDLQVLNPPTGTTYRLRFMPAYNVKENRIFYFVKAEKQTKSGITPHFVTKYYNQIDPCPNNCPINDILPY